MRKADEEAVSQPTPTTSDITDGPGHAAVWVLRAGITPERARSVYGMGWSDKIQRVVVPILHNFKPSGQWLARATDGRKPKYLFGKGANDAFWLAEQGSKEIVVVEDILSAIKVWETGYDALAVCGTNVSQQAALAMAGRCVVGWFDGDKAGDEGFLRLKKALGPFGAELRKVRSDRDPKTYNRDEVRRHINGS